MNISDLDVVQHPHPALRWVAKEVPTVTPLVQDVAKRMIELMHDYKGVGLAATQIAVPWRIFVTCVNDKELVFINPKIHLGKNKRDTRPGIAFDQEGCLSFPGLKVPEPVPRSRSVYVEALDITGKPFAISGPGLLARVIQHENDHLNGVLFIDHLKLTDEIQVGEEAWMTLKEYVDSWLDYIKTGYDFVQNSQKPKYGTDEEEKQKLLNLENLLLMESNAA
jgi:peptide deformylase